MRQTVFAIATALVVVALAAPAFAFRPFTEVKNVCPECDQPGADVVELATGRTIRGKVVAENTDFYTVVRYTEARAIPKGEVKTIEWADGSKPSGLNSHDQIVLQNGVVFSGSITEDKEKPALYQLKSNWNEFTYIVFKSEVEKVYEGGQEVM